MKKATVESYSDLHCVAGKSLFEIIGLEFEYILGTDSAFKVINRD